MVMTLTWIVRDQDLIPVEAQISSVHQNTQLHLVPNYRIH